MKIFWPQRPPTKGFSIETLARKYREKISIVSSNKISNQFLCDRNLKSIKEDSNHIAKFHLSFKRGHWANRDFSEYRDVA